MSAGLVVYVVTNPHAHYYARGMGARGKDCRSE